LVKENANNHASATVRLTLFLRELGTQCDGEVVRISMTSAS
jgi:hypothetical protein